MKKISPLFLLLCFIMLFSKSDILAQEVLDMGKVDYISKWHSKGILAFENKLPDGRVETRYLTLKDTEGIAGTVRAWNIETDVIDVLEDYNCIDVNDIDMLEPSGLDKLLINKSLTLESDNVIRKKFAKISDFIFGYVAYQYDDSEDYSQYYEMPKPVGWQCAESNFYTYLYIKVADGKHIVALCDSLAEIQGFIVPLKDKLTVVHSSFWDVDVNYKDIETLGNEDRDVYCDNFVPVNYYFAFPLADNEGYELRNILGNKLLPKTEDSIKVHQNFITTYSKTKDKYEVYTKFLEKQELQDVRAIYFMNDELMQILDGSKLKYLGIKGLCALPPNEVTSIAMVEYFMNYELKRNRQNNKYSLSFGYKHEPKTRPKTVLLDNSKGIEQLQFLDGKAERDIYFFDENKSSDDNNFFKSNLLAVKKNGKYGIASYQLLANKGLFSLTNELPITCDSLSLRGYSYPVLFYQAGLKGYFPGMKEAKYTELAKNIEGIFARFTLPSGKEGWLHCVTGKEYSDK